MKIPLKICRSNMCKLYFYHSPMNSGKSMLLIAKAHSFGERGIPYLVFKSSIDTRNKGVIHSRAIGDLPCYTVSPTETFSKSVISTDIWSIQILPTIGAFLPFIST